MLYVRKATDNCVRCYVNFFFKCCVSGMCHELFHRINIGLYDI